MNYKLIDLNSFGDARGKLIALEKGRNCPFDVKRVFYIFDTTENVVRGGHANRNSEFLFVPICGSCRIKIDNGYKTIDVLLNNPSKALYLDKMLWKEMYDFSCNAILLVLTNTTYDENEYIKNYDTYLKEVKL